MTRRPHATRSRLLAAGRVIALFGIALLACLGLLEAGLRLGTPFPVDSPSANTVDDARLGHRMRPSLPGIDERGFRNRPGMETATVVAIGDSHTYGYNVDSEDSWPAELARLTGEPVYNMGIGGYGVLQYHDLLPLALALRPERILVALYLANDLVSVCGYVSLPHWKERIAGTRVERSCRLLTGPEGTPLQQPSETSLLKRTALGSAIFHLAWMPLKSELWIRGWIRAEDPSRLRIDDPCNGTLIALNRMRIHARFMDRSDPDVAVLFDYSMEVLEEMRRRLRDAGVDLGVMLVPTRERVMYGHLVEQGHDLPPEFERLFETESAAARRFLDFFASRGVDAVDLLPFVASRLEEGGVYPRREDGHPRAPGYAAYARGAYQAFFAPETEGGFRSSPTASR